jgi:RNA polymerase sigma-70 factor, ECF subfamily
VDAGEHTEPSEPRRAELDLLRDGGLATTWPDAWLIAAVRREPSDSASLDVLVGRYWKLLFGRCQMLTADREAASDLAQEAWLRVLRARHALDPNGNFPAYLVTIATNLWRDRHRSERRSGGMAEDRMASLDAAVPTREGETMVLADVLADPSSLPAEDQVLLKMDLDNALARLTPQARDVLTSRFLGGESAAEIGRRYGRTEQTITGWVREAIRDMKSYLGESPRLGAHSEKR